MRVESRSNLHLAEPAAHYTRYPPLVVDCSVLAAVLFDEEEREVAALAMAGKELFAPELLDHEMVSVALKKSRSGLSTAARTALLDLADLRLTRRAVNAVAQFELAARLKLSAYDAAYLQLALDLRAPLVTFDEKLGRVAEKALQDAQ